MRNKKEMKYIIKLTEEQMRVIRIALEEYFRLRMGQDMDFCNDLAFLDSKDAYDTSNPNHATIFDRYISRRNHMRVVMQAFFRIAFPPYGVPEEKTEDMLIAEDIWDAIRVKLGISRWDRALHVGPEPLPEIEIIGEK